MAENVDFCTLDSLNGPIRMKFCGYVYLLEINKKVVGYFPVTLLLQELLAINPKNPFY